MNNRIDHFLLTDVRLDPFEAEIRLDVFPEQMTRGTEIRGRLVGPRCRYATTIEVAYPLRELSRDGASRITVGAIVPEPSFWDPTSPFLYDASLELWQDGDCVDRAVIRHGLRTLRIGSRGLLLNDKPITLHGVEYGEISEDEAASLHEANVNVLFTPVTLDAEKHRTMRTIADELGFLQIDLLAGSLDMPMSAKLVMEVARSSCHVGWLVLQDALEVMLTQRTGIANLRAKGGMLGIWLNKKPNHPLPSDISFVGCSEKLMPHLLDLGLPFLLLSDRPLPSAATYTSQTGPPAILGGIYGVTLDAER